MKPTPRRHLLAALLLPILCLGQTARAATFTYDFENLSNGALGGFDNWVNEGGANYIVSTDILPGNGTQVVGNVNFGGSQFVKRTNGGSFDFGDLSGSNFLTLGFDGRFVGGGSDQIHFKLRNAANSVVSPIFGFEGDSSMLGDSDASLPGTINANDWVSIQMTVDMNLNTASLFYKNLTDGDTGFTAVAGLQNISVPVQNPSVWTEMSLRTGDYANNMVDNLYIATFDAVPEPSRAIFAALGFVGLILRRRR